MFSHHEQCPECASKGKDRAGDNLGVWKDGHKFCLSCGYHEAVGGVMRLETIAERLQEKQRNKSDTRIPTLPDDYSPDLPEVALNWLRKYDLTEDEIKRNHFGWSNEDHSLVLPVFDLNGNLLMAQRRRFITGKSRYFTTGLPEQVFHIIGNGNNNDCVCLTEDLISAIKVARVIPTMPIWGSQISQHRVWVLGQRYKNLIVWLDEDKAQYAIRKRNSFTPFFESVRIIVTEKDPKEYSTQQIKEILK